MPVAAENSVKPATPDRHVRASPAELRRVKSVGVAIACSLVALAAILGHHQLRRRAHYLSDESRQSHRRVPITAPRGTIYDRDHRILAGMRTQTAAVLDLGQLRNEALHDELRFFASDRTIFKAAMRDRVRIAQRDLERVNAITGRNTQLDVARLERAFAHERSVPFVLEESLTADEIVRLSAVLKPDEALRLSRSLQRWYPFGRGAAHAIGRVHREPVPPPRRKPGDFATMSSTALAGEFGLELQFDSRLKGQPGEAVTAVDALGFPVGPLDPRREPAPGEDVVSSLDIDLQLAAERAMSDTPGQPRGAAVAISVKTGEILVLASKPDFDLNAISPTIPSSLGRQIETDGGWLNRATQGLYPPGSTFKIFTAIAGLRGGTLQPDDIIHCDGYIELGDRRYPCHNVAGHGDISLREALAHSCNVFAYEVGLAAGPDALAAEARRFHLASPTGIELSADTRRSIVPDPAWKKSSHLGPWTAGDTVNFSIGQGFVRYSPLQAACAIASLARRETLTVPTLMFQPGRQPTGDRPREPLGLSDENYAALIEGLQAVIETGIGRDAQVPGVSIAGKTGTAQVTRPEGTLNIAWFVAFAPVEDPEIAVAVAMEGGEFNVQFAGGQHAAPIVREIIGAYFDKRAKH
jgi:penicillin-binding protein 2